MIDLSSDFSKKILSRVPFEANNFVVADLIKKYPDRSFLYVVCDDKSADSAVKSINKVVGANISNLFPAWDCLPYDRISPKASIVGERLNTLANLLSNNPKQVTVTTINALLTKVVPKNFIKNSSLEVSVGDEYSIEDLSHFLIANGYHNVSNVNETGEYSIKGSLVDIFPSSLNMPVRIDFYGDKIDSVRSFDPVTQISNRDNFNNVSITPASEVILNPETIEIYKKNFRKNFAYDETNSIFYQDSINGITYQGIEHYLPLYYTQLCSLFDYLSDHIIIFQQNSLSQIDEREKSIADYYNSRKLNYERKQDKNYFVIESNQIYLTNEELGNFLNDRQVIEFDSINHLGENLNVKKVPSFYKQGLAYKKSAFDIVKEYLAKDTENLKIIITSNNSFSLDRINRVLADHDIIANIVDDFPTIASPYAYLIEFPLDSGFKIADYLFISEQDLLGVKIDRKSGSKKKADKLILEKNSICEGEYVVHKEHGVAMFLGLKGLEVLGNRHDFLTLQYHGKDKLYVPVENIDMIARYGQTDGEIKLDKLGSLNWQQRKAKLKKRIKDIADELIKIASERELKTAKQFYSNDIIRNEFDAKFPFTETADQLNAIDDVIKDLRSGRPMDRLICGDVGYGKTEIAMRAAFNVVNNDYNEKSQIALIVPTTLLARQHYNNFVERFAGFDVKIAQLSRLISNKEKKEVKLGLENGEIDIVIGTHALLADNIKFKNLSLVIVDEEQHFGVSQKEKLKKLKNEVHLLTLSATPIPRTLQMSLSGIRDLSLLATAPVDRMAVRTFIMPFDQVIIREAILREIFRGGRVYYVCPKIKDLHAVHERLTKLIPEVKIVVAHGQMKSSELDEIMTDFCDGKYQLLLSTTIIESGIDIAEANTIIIHKAYLFGLSQLYQLRGRVGRSKVRAYAYLLTDDRMKLSKNAEQRLEVMQTLEGLGAGFSLASYDMDIRGAGNLLGEEQSGHIKEVGVELYQQMLKQAIADNKAKVNIKDEEILETDDDYSPSINVGVSVLIPESYIFDEGSRIEFYRRIANSSDQNDINEIMDELCDRFGNIPEEVINLFKIVELKQICKTLNIEKIEAGPKAILICFRDNKPSEADKLIDYVTKNPLFVKIRPDQKLVIKFADNCPSRRIEKIKKVLGEIT